MAVYTKKTKYIIIIVLQIVSFMLLFWSFKMHINLFSRTDTIGIQNNKKLLLHEHITTTILDTGVCPLGKIGAWFFMLWIGSLIAVMLSYKKYKVDKILAWVNFFINVILLCFTILLGNFALAVRASPYFIVQFITSMVLLQKTDEEEEL